MEKVLKDRKFSRKIRGILTMLGMALVLVTTNKVHAAPLVEEEVTSEGKASYEDVTDKDKTKEKGNTQDGEAKVDNSKGGSDSQVKPDPIKEPDKDNPAHPDYNVTDNKIIDQNDVKIDTNNPENYDEVQIKTSYKPPYTPPTIPQKPKTPKTGIEDGKMGKYAAGAFGGGAFAAGAGAGIYLLNKKRKVYHNKVINKGRR